MSKGTVRTDGKWIAGFHFNSALFRMASVYHRILKIATREDGEVKDLRPPAVRLYKVWTRKVWISEELQMVHRQVNDLKHDTRGIFEKRTVKYEHAMRAFSQLLDFAEARVMHDVDRK